MIKKGRIAAFALLILIPLLVGFIYFRFFFVFGEGVKAGELNQFMLKGYLFKTYEGRLIQSGFKGAYAGVTDSTIGSYVFEFSVENETVADSLMKCSGKTVELHYKEYLGRLPWRGMEKHIVDKIVSVRNEF